MKKSIFLLTIFIVACTATPAPTAPIANSVSQDRHPATDTPSASNMLDYDKVLVTDQGDYYLYSLDGTQFIRLYTRGDSPLQMASLSPDGTQFAYFKDNFLYVQDIQLQQTTTLNQEIIASSGWIMRWSPDSRLLAMSCSNAAQRKTAICQIDIESGEITFLITEKNIDEFCATNQDSIALLDWGQDGTEIVYTCFITPEKGQKELFAIYLYDLGTSTSQRIFDNFTQNTIWYLHSASISPDNNLLLINGSTALPVSQIFLLNIQTNSLKQLTAEENYHATAQLWRKDSLSFYVNRTRKEIPYEEANIVMNINGDVLSSISIKGAIVK